MLTATALAQVDIPESGRIRVDGKLNDWQRAKWFPLNATIEGNPAHISNARWSLVWDEDAVVYIAVQYDDTEIVLQDGFVNSNAQDGVEIYVRGDTGSSPSDYSKTQSSAQCYSIGLMKDKKNRRIRLGDLKKIPLHNPVKAIVVLEGTRFTYEIMVPLYDSFDATTRRRSSESELYVGQEIGVDIAIIDVGKTGKAGRLGKNSRNKRNDAGQIAERTLEE